MSEALGYSAPWERVLVWALVLLLLVLILFPFVWLLVMSLKTDQDIFAWPPRLLFTPTLANNRALWNGNFPRSPPTAPWTAPSPRRSPCWWACPAPGRSRA